MLSRRLQRLAALTQGFALVGLGVSSEACNNDPPHINSPPTINATAEPMPIADASAPTTDLDAGMMPPTANSPPMMPDSGTDAGLSMRPPHTVNAPPKGFKPPPPSTAKP